MTFRSRILAAAVLGLGLAQPHAGRAADLPTPSAPSAAGASQSTANAVAERLRQSGLLRHYNVTVSARGGAVELTGSVANAAQREQVVQLAKGTPGVTGVADSLSVLAPNAIRQVQVVVPGGPREIVPPPALRDAPPLLPRGGDAPQGGLLPEPVPVFQAPPASPYDLNPPPMPPYAWPTYAPYNNYSRVAYPQTYPAQAWPYIGPCYPFPKVPLGWRSVTLEWEDGYWWFSKTATKHDFWKLRYW